MLKSPIKMGPIHCDPIIHPQKGNTITEDGSHNYGNRDDKEDNILGSYLLNNNNAKNNLRA